MNVARCARPVICVCIIVGFCSFGCTIEPNPSPLENGPFDYPSEGSSEKEPAQSDSVQPLVDAFDQTQDVGRSDRSDQGGISISDRDGLLQPLDTFSTDIPRETPCAIMSGRASRVIRFELVPLGEFPCDANNDGIVDASDTQLNALFAANDALEDVNLLIAKLIESNALVVIFDPRGWSGTYVKAVMDVFPAVALQPECQDMLGGEEAQIGCPYLIPPESLNYNSCATTGIHGVEYGLAGTPMASVPANVLLTPPLFGLEGALLFYESRLQGVIDETGQIPDARWCGRLDMASLSAQLGELCTDSEEELCSALLSVVSPTACEGKCSVTLRLATTPTGEVVKEGVK